MAIASILIIIAPRSKSTSGISMLMLPRREVMALDRDFDSFVSVASISHP
jgi:hypothetical protein